MTGNADTDEMACRELVERVTDYLDAALSDADRMRFEAHVAECPGCLEILEQFRVVVAATSALRTEDAYGLDPVARDRLLDRFRTWSAGTS